VWGTVERTFPLNFHVVIMQQVPPRTPWRHHTAHHSPVSVQMSTFPWNAKISWSSVPQFTETSQRVITATPQLICPGAFMSWLTRTTGMYKIDIQLSFRIVCVFGFSRHALRDCGMRILSLDVSLFIRRSVYGYNLISLPYLFSNPSTLLFVVRRCFWFAPTASRSLTLYLPS
jgi:hypothetical protein